MKEHYELLYIIPFTKHTEEEINPVINKISELIKGYGGENLKRALIGRKKLSYVIKQQRQGYYISEEFDLAKEKFSTLDRELRFNEDVLRHLIIKKRQKTTEEIKTEEKIKSKIEKEEEEKIKEAIKEKDEAAKSETKKPEVGKGKVSLEELDKKLEEILGDDMLK